MSSKITNLLSEKNKLLAEEKQLKLSRSAILKKTLKDIYKENQLSQSNVADSFFLQLMLNSPISSKLVFPLAYKKDLSLINNPEKLIKKMNRHFNAILPNSGRSELSLYFKSGTLKISVDCKNWKYDHGMHMEKALMMNIEHLAILNRLISLFTNYSGYSQRVLETIIFNIEINKSYFIQEQSLLKKIQRDYDMMSVKGRRL